MRQLAYLSAFSSEIQHVSGTANSPAHTLSRIDNVNALSQRTQEAPTDPLNIHELADTQANDSKLSRLRSAHTALEIEDVPFRGVLIVCDMSTGIFRPFLTASNRRRMFDAIHNTAQTAVRASQKLIASRFAWPRLNADICDWVRTSTPCQRSEVQSHSVPPVSPMNVLLSFILTSLAPCYLVKVTGSR